MFTEQYLQLLEFDRHISSYINRYRKAYLKDNTGKRELLIQNKTSNQGLTLRFQARGPKRNFDKNQWSKTQFLVIKHTILGP